MWLEYRCFPTLPKINFFLKIVGAKVSTHSTHANEVPEKGSKILIFTIFLENLEPLRSLIYAIYFGAYKGQ